MAGRLPCNAASTTSVEGDRYLCAGTCAYLRTGNSRPRAWAGRAHSCRAAPWSNDRDGGLARECRIGLCGMDPRVAAVIRVDAVWLAVEPMDMRAGMETALARVVKVFGAARPHHAYLFANRRANRIKVLVHDGIGIWLAARRLHQGKFIWSAIEEQTMSLSRAQFDALVLGLPWQRVGERGIITVI